MTARAYTAIRNVARNRGLRGAAYYTVLIAVSRWGDWRDRHCTDPITDIPGERVDAFWVAKRKDDAA